MTKQWENSKFKFTIPSDNVYIRAMANLQSKLSKWDIDDYVLLYSGSDPNWAAVSQTFNEYYMDLDDSFEIVQELLEFQLNCENEDEDHKYRLVKEFLTCVFNVCEKKIPKKNTIYVVSPHSAGKKYFLT